MHAHVYYLNWDDDDDLREMADELRYSLPDAEYPDADVIEDDVYRFVGSMTGIDGKGEVYRKLNRGVPEGDWESYNILDGERSLSPGDVVVMGDTNGGEVWICLSFGWEQLGTLKVRKTPIDHDRELGAA